MEFNRLSLVCKLSLGVFPGKLPKVKEKRAPGSHVGFIYFLLTFVTLALYWPVHGFQFLDFDDPGYVSSNPNVFQKLTSPSSISAYTLTKVR